MRDKQATLDQVGIQAKDASTLLVTLESPYPYFLDLLSTPPFFPMSGEFEEPSDFNGPFAVAEWKRNSCLHLSQNPFLLRSSTNQTGWDQNFDDTRSFSCLQNVPRWRAGFYRRPHSVHCLRKS